ncbi:MAG: AAA family ATPase [Gammaproteobacteria bacterium]|nr:AAA family ATPase [Gammaproteobacteria bacterium]
MQRTLLNELAGHYREHRQMAFLSGPRQVGKTTLAKALTDLFPGSEYLNWDNQAHRAVILDGPQAVASRLGLERLLPSPPLCAFAELHKYRHWRNFLKGFFDQHESRARILVTGSASLATFSRGGDSLMGRYFPYRCIRYPWANAWAAWPVAGSWANPRRSTMTDGRRCGASAASPNPS